MFRYGEPRADALARLRRSYTAAQLSSHVGYVGNELHRLDCCVYEEMARWPEPGRETCPAGLLRVVLLALIEDEVTPPAFHDCLRAASLDTEAHPS